MKIDDNISRFFKSIFAPYAEVDGIKFYRKSSFEDYMNQKEAEKAKKIKDKNGKQRKAGFLVALKWFKDNYADAYKAIAAKKKG